MLKILANGDVGRDGGVDGVVVEGDKSEVGEAAEEGRKTAGDVGV